jgi:hypothetical protein
MTEPMRLRVLGFPAQGEGGGGYRVPYILILDRVPVDLTRTEVRQELNGVAQQLGAEGLLVFPDEVEIG